MKFYKIRSYAKINISLGVLGRFYSKNHKIVKCQNCSHIQLSPIPTIRQEEKFYNENFLIDYTNDQKIYDDN